MPNPFIDDAASLSGEDSGDDIDSFDFNEPDIDGLINNDIESSQSNDDEIVFKKRRVNPKDNYGPNILGNLNESQTQVLSESLVDTPAQSQTSVAMTQLDVLDDVVDEVVQNDVVVEYEGEQLLETPEESVSQRDNTGKYCRKGVFSLTLHLRRLQHVVTVNGVDEDFSNGEGKGFPKELLRLIQQCGRLNIAEVVGQYEVGEKTNQLHFQCMIVFHTKATIGKEHKMSCAYLCDQIRAIVPNNDAFNDNLILEPDWNNFFLQVLHVKSTREKLRKYCTDPTKRYFGQSHSWKWNNSSHTISNIHASVQGGASANVFAMIKNGSSYDDICDQQPGLALIHRRNITTMIQEKHEKAAKSIESRCGNRYCKYKHLSNDQFQIVSTRYNFDLETLKREAALGCLFKTCYSFGPGACGKTTFSRQLSKFWGDGSVYVKPSGQYYGSLSSSYTNEKCLMINDLDQSSFGNFGDFKRVIDCHPCPIDIKNSSGTMVASSVVMDSNHCPCHYFEMFVRDINEFEYSAFCRRLTYIFEFSKAVTGVVIVRRVKMPLWNAFMITYHRRKLFFEKKMDKLEPYVYEQNEILKGESYKQLYEDSL